MNNAIRIFKKDLKNIFTNWIAIVVVLMLMIIPSLYSLINIKACWDPYSNTSGMKVAIINKDKGTNFKDKSINLGDELVDKLKDNDRLEWNFVDEETGKEGLLSEKYYATIEIPEDFSESVTTLFKKDIKQPKLIYTANEKINPIAPKITDAAVKTLKSQLDDNIKKTVSGIILRICDEVGIDIQNNRPELRKIIDDVYKLDENMPEIESILNGAINGTKSDSELLNKINEIIPTVSDTIDATDEFLKDNEDMMEETQGDLSDISPLIKDKLVESEKILDNSSVALGNLDEKILPETARKALLITSDSAKATKVTVEDIKSKLDSIQKFIDKIDKINIKKPTINKSLQSVEVIQKLQDEFNKQVKLLKDLQQNLKDASEKISDVQDKLDKIDDKLDSIITKSNEDIAKLDNGELLDTNNLKDLRKLIDDVHTLTSNIVDSYDSQFVPAVDKGFKSIKEATDNGLTLLGENKDTLPDVQNVLSTFTNISDLSNEQLNKLKDKFPGIKDRVHKLADKFRQIDNKKDIDELLELITNNWEDQSSFMASPVEIQDNRLYPWPNYGSTVTPFYTTLCLWIGAYMLSILLKVEETQLDEGIQVKPHEIYFGKMFLFLFIGIGQAVVASTGALYLLGSYCVHPIMFICYSIFASIVFMIIVYTSVSVFGYGGIIAGIVLLIIQVAGTSANFPIEVNPTIFQNIFPFLPFTYCIGAMRQIMAGIVYSILFKDTAILCVFMIGSIIIGICFKKRVNNKIDIFIKKLKESSIMNV
ncbi:ABC-2 family transporter protein [Clostridium saccharobutylicum]|uniref:YhgE/Pip domain-containing protein n=1 Tax=Clostridium saccharobutylicum TaxID=169679 RepID=UPI00098397DB|nr:YhgE/Pip domain-containing protein [Clostridium saccharobutylicum]AQR99376.1 ABC-2 family transporter protein [Clostridium saccharobutylicum]AQS13362.1 ABC-2 family transporter protein [Clostridium saccharobutylicum]